MCKRLCSSYIYIIIIVVQCSVRVLHLLSRRSLILSLASSTDNSARSDTRQWRKRKKCGACCYCKFMIQCELQPSGYRSTIEHSYRKQFGILRCDGRPMLCDRSRDMRNCMVKTIACVIADCKCLFSLFSLIIIVLTCC